MNINVIAHFIIRRDFLKKHWEIVRYKQKIMKDTKNIL